jgi:hypothetical protein
MPRLNPAIDERSNCREHKTQQDQRFTPGRTGVFKYLIKPQSIVQSVGPYHLSGSPLSAINETWLASLQ